MTDDNESLQITIKALQAENRQLYKELSRLRQIAVWLKECRDTYEENSVGWYTIDVLLQDYVDSLGSGEPLIQE